MKKETGKLEASEIRKDRNLTLKKWIQTSNSNPASKPHDPQMENLS